MSGWRDSSASSVLALQAAFRDLISGIQYYPFSLPGVILESKARRNPGFLPRYGTKHQK